MLLTLTKYSYIWVISLINNRNNRFIPACILKGGFNGFFLWIISKDFIRSFGVSKSIIPITQFYNVEVNSERWQISKMERFGKIVNG